MKTEQKYFTILSIIVLSMVMFSGVKAQSSTNNKESARIFVQKFYDEYFKLDRAWNENKKRTDTDATAYIIENKPQYFTNELLAALKTYETNGYIFHPFLSNMAIYDESNYQTGNVSESGEHFFIDVHTNLIGESRQTASNGPVVILVTVINLHNHFKIADFYYTSSNEKGSFLTLMKQYKLALEEWLKNPR